MVVSYNFSQATSVISCLDWNPFQIWMFGVMRVSVYIQSLIRECTGLGIRAQLNVIRGVPLELITNSFVE